MSNFADPFCFIRSPSTLDDFSVYRAALADYKNISLDSYLAALKIATIKEFRENDLYTKRFSDHDSRFLNEALRPNVVHHFLPHMDKHPAAKTTLIACVALLAGHKKLHETRRFLDAFGLDANDAIHRVHENANVFNNPFDTVDTFFRVLNLNHQEYQPKPRDMSQNQFTPFLVPQGDEIDGNPINQATLFRDRKMVQYAFQKHGQKPIISVADPEQLGNFWALKKFRRKLDRGFHNIRRNRTAEFCRS